MKSLPLIQCAFAAFANRDKSFFDSYKDDIILLSDEGGKLAIELMLSYIDNPNISDDAFFDILSQYFDDDTIINIMSFRLQDDIELLLPHCQKKFLNEKENELKIKLIKNKISLNDAIAHLNKLQISLSHTPNPTNDKIAIPANEIINSAQKPIHWIVDKIIPAGTLNVIAGLPKSGKSLLVLDLAINLAANLNQWLGCVNIKPCKVLYIDAENADSLIQLRLKQLGANLLNCSNLHFITRSSLNCPKINILDKNIRNSIKYAANYLNLSQNDLIIIDSFRRTFAGNENDSQEIANIMAAYYELSPAAKLIIHHLKKQNNDFSNSTNKIRGSGDITAAVDSLLTFHTEGTDFKESTLSLDLARWSANIHPINIAWKFNPKTQDRLAFLALSNSQLAQAQFNDLNNILNLLDKTNSGLTAQEIIAQTGLPTTACQRALAFAKSNNKIATAKIDNKTYYRLVH